MLQSPYSTFLISATSPSSPFPPIPSFQQYVFSSCIFSSLPNILNRSRLIYKLIDNPHIAQFCIWFYPLWPSCSYSINKIEFLISIFRLLAFSLSFLYFLSNNLFYIFIIILYTSTMHDSETLFSYGWYMNTKKEYWIEFSVFYNHNEAPLY